MLKAIFNYESPEVKVTEILTEGVLCSSGIPGSGSGDINDYDDIIELLD